jgi:hypothetical protein
MTGITIKREATAKGAACLGVDGHESEMTFNWADQNGQKLMIIAHTGVPGALAGRGVGLALVQRAVEDARAEKFRILPLCSFARVMIQRRKEWQYVLASKD